MMNNTKAFPVITICGSMRFYAEMIRLAEILTYKQYIVLMPFAMKSKIATKNNEEQKEIEAMLDTMHKIKIDMCDMVLIVDTTEFDFLLGNPPYTGYSTRREIGYADEKHKRVHYYDVLLLMERLHLDPSIPDAL